MNSKEIRWPRIALYSLVLVLLAALFLAPASAEEKSAKATTLEMKITSSGPRPEKAPVGDDPGHTMQLLQGSGTAVLSDGQKAQYQIVGAWDSYIGWFAKGQGYGKYTFKDGSWILSRWQSEWIGKSDEDGNPLFKSTGTIIKGGGIYLGIKGTLNASMRMLPARKGYPAGITEIDSVLTYTLPKQ